MGCRPSIENFSDVDNLWLQLQGVERGYYLSRTDVLALGQGSSCIILPKDETFELSSQFYYILFEGEVEYQGYDSQMKKTNIRRSKGDLINHEGLFDPKYTPLPSTKIHARTPVKMYCMHIRAFDRYLRSPRLPNNESWRLAFTQSPFALLTIPFPTIAPNKLDELSHKLEYRVYQAGQAIQPHELLGRDIHIVLAGKLRRFPVQLPVLSTDTPSVVDCTTPPLSEEQVETISFNEGDDPSAFYRRLKPQLQHYVKTSPLISRLTTGDLVPGDSFNELSYLIDPRYLPETILVALEKTLVVTIPHHIYESTRAPQQSQDPAESAIHNAITGRVRSRLTTLLDACQIGFFQFSGRPNFLEQMVHNCELFGMDQGNVVQKDASQLDRVLIVLSGSLKITSSEVKECYLHPGDFYGEIGLVYDTTRWHSIVVVSAHCLYLTVSRQSFEKLLLNTEYAYFCVRLGRDLSTIESILMYEPTKLAFLSFAQKERSAENLAFYNAILAFRQKMDGVTRNEVKLIRDDHGRPVVAYSYADLYTELLDIFNTFIRAGHAVTEVNLRSDVIDRVRSALFDELEGVGPDGLPNGLTHTVLDEALTETISLMRDTLQRFRKDRSFIDVLATVPPFRGGWSREDRSSPAPLQELNPFHDSIGIGVNNSVYIASNTSYPYED